ncbi:MAG: hypothetical protein KBC91_05140 [Candidatus Omnitrophica bacterium]|nr:hypothetical protein [Candidatus Omnitrophota bacterium]
MGRLISSWNKLGDSICFGPVASFAASGLLTSIGALILRNVRKKRELLFAVFPALFALQQFIEGLLWLLLKAEKSQALVHALTLTYLFFAYTLWPIICPLSVYAIEYKPKRKQMLRILMALGLLTGSYLLFFILKNSAHASVLHCSIRYETHLAGPRWFTFIYLAVIILPYFVSSHRAILIFGIPNLLLCLVAYFFYNTAFISVWCFFAAVVSMSLYFFLRRLHHQPMLGISAP